MLLRTGLALLATLAASSCAGISFRGSSQEVDWFPGGLYGGGMYGTTQHELDADDLDEALGKLGYTTTTDLGDEDSAYQFYAGYRFGEHVGLELGYVNLGRLESDVTANPAPADPDVFLGHVADLHPILGAGWQLQARWFALRTGRLELSLGAGAWFWEADVDATAGSGEAEGMGMDELDPTFGAAATFRLFDRLSLRAAWDRYYMDDQYADALWGGLELGLLRRTRRADPL